MSIHIQLFLFRVCVVEILVDSSLRLSSSPSFNLILNPTGRILNELKDSPHICSRLFFFFFFLFFKHACQGRRSHTSISDVYRTRCTARAPCVHLMGAKKKTKTKTNPKLLLLPCNLFCFVRFFVTYPWSDAGVVNAMLTCSSTVWCV